MDAFTVAKLRLPDKIEEVQEPKAEAAPSPTDR